MHFYLWCIFFFFFFFLKTHAAIVHKNLVQYTMRHKTHPHSHLRKSSFSNSLFFFFFISGIFFFLLCVKNRWIHSMQNNKLHYSLYWKWIFQVCIGFTFLFHSKFRIYRWFIFERTSNTTLNNNSRNNV